MTTYDLSDAPVIVVAMDEQAAGAVCATIAAAGAAAVVVEPSVAASAVLDQPRVSGVVTVIPDSAGEAEPLPQMITAAREAGLPVIVLLTDAQLDSVGADLLAPGVTLLCDASALEIAGAVALMLSDAAPVVRDGAREAARLQQLNAEVARFAAMLAKLSGQDQSRGPDAAAADPFVAEQSRTFGSEPVVDVDPAEVRRAIRARRMRDDAFGRAGLFEDPAWDMLLDLFAAELERRRVSVSSLCIAAAVAPTTALRWIGKLIDADLLDRRPDDFDRRRAFISLSARASTAMRNYVAAVKRAGLALA